MSELDHRLIEKSFTMCGIERGPVDQSKLHSRLCAHLKPNTATTGLENSSDEEDIIGDFDEGDMNVTLQSL